MRYGRLIAGTLLAASLIGLVGCSQGRIDRFIQGEHYESYGVVKEKEFSENLDLRRHNLTATNSEGETFVDDYLVTLVEIPEFPNTAYVINSPRLYNSVSKGDTVDLVLQDHSHWLEDSEGNPLTRPSVNTSIIDYSARTTKEIVESR